MSDVTATSACCKLQQELIASCSKVTTALQLGFELSMQAGTKQELTASLVQFTHEDQCACPCRDSRWAEALGDAECYAAPGLIADTLSRCYVHSYLQPYQLGQHVNLQHTAQGKACFRSGYGLHFQALICTDSQMPALPCRLAVAGRSSSQRLHGEAALSALPPSGHANLLSAVIAGCTGLVAQPLRGLREGGAAGLLRGVFRGSLGLLILPLNSLLGTAATLSACVRDRLLGPDVLPPRLRPPRHVSSREPLSLYCWIEVRPAAEH